MPQLRSNGFAVVPNFLSPAEVTALKEDVTTLKAEGRFKVAGVGEANTNRVADDVRRCEQCFLYPRVKHGSGGHAGARTMLYDVFEGIRDELASGSGEPLDGLLTEGLMNSAPFALFVTFLVTPGVSAGVFQV